MSPTVFREGKYRFFFFSREEHRVHIHVVSPDGEAKYWVEPAVALVTSWGLSEHELRDLQKTIERRRGEILQAWSKHFGP
ncbi:MAG TPA: DUF4160 domain-containing protein [Phycisphaerales bacterium]|nr:DUF4160 domain-containing protein [Phycisphaerales bacterium]